MMAVLYTCFGRTFLYLEEHGDEVGEDKEDYGVNEVVLLGQLVGHRAREERKESSTLE